MRWAGKNTSNISLPTRIQIINPDTKTKKTRNVSDNWTSFDRSQGKEAQWMKSLTGDELISLEPIGNRMDKKAQYSASISHNTKNQSQDSRTNFKSK